jgi:hypothetical protein
MLPPEVIEHLERLKKEKEHREQPSLPIPLEDPKERQEGPLERNREPTPGPVVIELV